MTEKVKVVACPTCGKDVEWRPENTWRPFCGERCKMIDLGEWAEENYRVAEQNGLSSDIPPDETGRI
jgi:endogenous inhibitor of DNA gyrase (YacG/DUF329 family)